MIRNQHLERRSKTIRQKSKYEKAVVRSPKKGRKINERRKRIEEKQKREEKMRKYRLEKENVLQLDDCSILNIKDKRIDKIKNIEINPYHETKWVNTYLKRENVVKKKGERCRLYDKNEREITIQRNPIKIKKLPIKVDYIYK
jgi:hypothetical protein